MLGLGGTPGCRRGPAPRPRSGLAGRSEQGPACHLCLGLSQHGSKSLPEDVFSAPAGRGGCGGREAWRNAAGQRASLSRSAVGWAGGSPGLPAALVCPPQREPGVWGATPIPPPGAAQPACQAHCPPGDASTLVFPPCPRSHTALTCWGSSSDLRTGTHLKTRCTCPRELDSTLRWERRPWPLGRPGEELEPGVPCPVAWPGWGPWGPCGPVLVSGLATRVDRPRVLMPESVIACPYSLLGRYSSWAGECQAPCVPGLEGASWGSGCTCWLREECSGQQVTGLGSQGPA